MSDETIISGRLTGTGKLVWLLLTGKEGDNCQLRALTTMLGADARKWQLRHNVLRELPNTWLGASKISLRNALDFEEPWPDLVVGVGRRNVPIARWIRKASPKPTRLVWLGRPRAPLNLFDLVLSTGQYSMPDAPNLVRIPLPLTDTKPSGKALRRVAMLGGSSWSAKITTTFLDDFARLATGDGTQLVSLLTSPRSPVNAADYLREKLGYSVEIYDWATMKGRDNPYRTWLGEAASCVVSGDSISMLSDAVSTGRPVSVMPMDAPPWLSAIRKTGWGRDWLERAGNWSTLAPPPNLDGLFDGFIHAGLAVPHDDMIHFDNALRQVRWEQANAVTEVAALFSRQPVEACDMSLDLEQALE